MKILVATSLTQGCRSGDVAAASEGEMVLPDLATPNKFIGVCSGKMTTTALVAESEQLGPALARQIAGHVAHKDDFRAFLEAVADAANMMEIAKYFNVGEVIERKDTNYRARLQ